MKAQIQLRAVPLLSRTRVREELRRLQRSEDHFRSLGRKTTEVAAILDSFGTIQFESQVIAPVLGHDHDDLIGRNVLEFVHPDDHQVVVDTLARVVRQVHEVHETEFRFRHRKGDFRWLHAEGQSWLDSRGELKIAVNCRLEAEQRRGTG